MAIYLSIAPSHVQASDGGYKPLSSNETTALPLIGVVAAALVVRAPRLRDTLGLQSARWSSEKTMVAVRAAADEIVGFIQHSKRGCPESGSLYLHSHLNLSSHR